MTTRLRSIGLIVLTALLSASAVDAQSTGSAAATQPAATADGESSRPATTTFYGDTGLWYVPTAEILPHGKFSVSGYRRGTNYIQGYTNVGDFAGTVGVGVRDRVELFGAFLFDTRIDRDTRPLFINDTTVGGIVDRYPLVNSPWSGDHVGDLYAGAKINLLSEYRQNPAAFAARGIVKVPTGNRDAGVSTGKTDLLFDVIASKDAGKVVDVSGYAGYAYRGSPDGFDIPTGAFRWGAGAAFPSHSPVRVFTELNGDVPSGNTAALTTATLVGIDGSGPPVTSNIEKLTRATLGVTFQVPKGFFVGVGASWNAATQARDLTRAQDDPTADYWDWQLRIGYHRGVRVYAPPPPPPPPAPPPAPAPPSAHDLSVRAECNPCTVNAGQKATVTAVAQDSVGCALTHRWTAPAGTFANAAASQTQWTAPQQEGAVPVTVTATCPTDNKTASASVNIQVTRPPARTYTFEDVHFDFDRYTLRPAATRVLDEAVTALQEDRTLRVTIEGHTCNIGTAEYNLALGERRATAVRDYLISRGVATERLQTISYGEERPKYDNAREETRRLNRRAALVVNLQR
jgi:outer membrane protein OmpA-like peptidoglycan-associated protein